MAHLVGLTEVSRCCNFLVSDRWIKVEDIKMRDMLTQPGPLIIVNALNEKKMCMNSLQNYLSHLSSSFSQ